MSSPHLSTPHESDLAGDVKEFLEDLSHQGHRVAQVQTQARMMPEPLPHYRGELQVSDPGSSRAKRTRYRSPSDVNDTESASSVADDETRSNGSSNTASSMAESLRAERRRPIPPFWDRPRPAAIAQTTASALIPCEFHWELHGECEAEFKSTDIDGWVQHVVSQHLERKLPPTAACWFCDEFLFQARSDEFEEELYNFSTRIRHIAQHFRGGQTVLDIRPDFYLLEHLRRHGLISRAEFERTKNWHEAPQPRGGINAERSRARSRCDEKIEFSHRHHRRRH